MKRFIFLTLWSGFVSLLILLLFVPERTTHAGSIASVPLQRKISKDILQKVAEGRSSDLVRVIIQPANQPDFLDSTIEYSGGSNLRKFKNFSVRVVTLPVQAAIAIASRSDVSYVSLNRDVRPLGHLTATTGADQIRSSGSNGSLDGTGIGIAILDSGIDTAHASFLNKSNNIC